jgi:xylan 1,4-beta-xylosidase
MTVRNPVLPGFHPDPSLCRVGDEFFIANSTFEYYPGVAIHRSVDLAHWTPVGYALTRPSQLDMRGNPPSGGIWAPCLSHDGERFYLVFTDVKEWGGPANRGESSGFKDVRNYICAAPAIEGPWSEPAYANSSGFDASLFHDDDGSKWFVNMLWDYRNGRNAFAGIRLQRWDPASGRLVGPATDIYRGTERRLTEGPHLYKRGGWYYLMVAEGGTVWEHAVTVARSRRIEGPYETHPANPLLTSLPQDRLAAFQAKMAAGDEAGARSLLKPGLQKAGHASMVELSGDDWVLAHLCGRPLAGTLRCPLGRETSLQAVRWRDGWPWIDAAADGVPTAVDLPWKARAAAFPSVRADPNDAAGAWREDFGGPGWDFALNTLRQAADPAVYDLSARPGWLRLVGRDSPSSRFDQSLLARRVQHFSWSAATKIDFSPASYHEFAGLAVRYDENAQMLLAVTDLDGERVLAILDYRRGRLAMPLSGAEPRLAAGPVELAVDLADGRFRFRYRAAVPDGAGPAAGDWRRVGPDFPAAALSDEEALPLGFTGMYVGLFAVDLDKRTRAADFDYLDYRWPAEASPF